jgi:WhiB family redox-sensing transcriptional regulator
MSTEHVSAFLGERVRDTQQWTEGALCAQTDPEPWYPPIGGSHRQAKAICRECPVIAPCLAYAMEHAEQYGIWGGKSERERLVMRREQR